MKKAFFMAALLALAGCGDSTRIDAAKGLAKACKSKLQVELTFATLNDRVKLTCSDYVDETED